MQNTFLVAAEKTSKWPYLLFFNQQLSKVLTLAIFAIFVGLSILNIPIASLANSSPDENQPYDADMDKKYLKPLTFEFPSTSFRVDFQALSFGHIEVAKTNVSLSEYITHSAPITDVIYLKKTSQSIAPTTANSLEQIKNQHISFRMIESAHFESEALILVRRLDNAVFLTLVTEHGSTSRTSLTHHMRPSATLLNFRESKDDITPKNKKRITGESSGEDLSSADFINKSRLHLFKYSADYNGPFLAPIFDVPLNELLQISALQETTTSSHKTQMAKLAITSNFLTGFKLSYGTNPKEAEFYYLELPEIQARHTNAVSFRQYRPVTNYEVGLFAEDFTDAYLDALKDRAFNRNSNSLNCKKLFP